MFPIVMQKKIVPLFFLLFFFLLSDLLKDNIIMYSKLVTI